ncbi:MAG: DUF1624 domain-containing protein, partial [Pseudomonadota bacterium]|nr:DUF1624 domain-containing protein [Pseudomonadota bacterium]
MRSVDALRGLAILMMFAYHLSFDLRYFGVINADFEHDAFWLGFRALIVTAFMTLVGISLALAARKGVTATHFLKRVTFIALGALAATVASLVMFPASFIYFGILHCIAVTSVLAWPLRERPGIALLVGAIVLVAGVSISSPLFDTRYASWIG